MFEREGEGERCMRYHQKYVYGKWCDAINVMQCMCTFQLHRAVQLNWNWNSFFILRFRLTICLKSLVDHFSKVPYFGGYVFFFRFSNSSILLCHTIQTCLQVIGAHNVFSVRCRHLCVVCLLLQPPTPSTNPPFYSCVLVNHRANTKQFEKVDADPHEAEAKCQHQMTRPRIYR